MLASITPLGERSRGFSWGLTASAFAVGAVAAGAAGGAIGGALGSLAPGGGWRTAAGLAVLAAAVCFDGTRLGRRLPTSRRQVNEDWLGRYRGWVYGVAFGAQLGAGLATVVTSAAVYAAAVGAVLCGTVAGGAGLIRLHAALGRLERPARRLVVVGEILALGLLIGGLT